MSLSCPLKSPNSLLEKSIRTLFAPALDNSAVRQIGIPLEPRISLKGVSLVCDVQRYGKRFQKPTDLWKFELHYFERYHALSLIRNLALDTRTAPALAKLFNKKLDVVRNTMSNTELCDSLC